MNDVACEYPHFRGITLTFVGSQLFARGVNLNWPIRAQSGTCSSRFQTAVDVEHGPRMVVLPYGWILFKFSTTENGLVIILEVLYDGEFIWLYGNISFMVIRCSPSWRESILWSWYAENNCENGANTPTLRSKEGTTPTGNRLKRPRIVLKLRTRRNNNLTLRKVSFILTFLHIFYYFKISGKLPYKVL